MISTEARACQALIQQLKAKHKQIALQWIPRHCQIAGNEHADALAKKGAKITQTRIGETSYNSINLHLKHVFESVYRHELQTKLPPKPWKQEITKIPDWPRRKAVAEFRLCFGHDCLGTHLHRTRIRPDPYCMLCSLREPMDRNHLRQCKGKAVPLQAWTGSEGCRKLRFPDFVTTAQDGGKVVSLTHRPPLRPGNAPGTHFCLRLSRPQGHSAIGGTPAGIEPATFRFVTQHLNHCATAVPL